MGGIEEQGDLVIRVAHIAGVTECDSQGGGSGGLGDSALHRASLGLSGRQTEGGSAAG
jgi:hypothetical protein